MKLPILLVIAAMALGAGPAIEKTADTIVDPNVLYLPDGRWGTTLNGRSFQQDALASFNGWQYATWFDGDRRLCVGRRPLDAKEWQVIRFDDYRFKGNDTHNAAVLGICPADGTIHLSFDHHGHPLHYRFSRPGAAATPQATTWDASLFGPTIDQLEANKPVKRVTYPRFFQTPGGNLQFQCRIGGSGDGASWLADYIDGKWKDFAPIIGSVGTVGESDSRNAYENGYTYDAAGRLHVTWCWRESGDPMTNHDLLYAHSPDRGRTWHNNAGEVIGRRGEQLVTLATPGLKVWDIPQRRGLINSTTQALDSAGRVHVMTRELPDHAKPAATWDQTIAATTFHHYWRDDSGKWHRNATKETGQRGQLFFDAADNAYHVCVTDTLEIAAASSTSKWTDWRVIHREPGRFIAQPLIDVRRVREDRVLSVYVQEASTGENFSPLRIIEYRLPAQNQ